jgi:hypothetical protein
MLSSTAFPPCGGWRRSLLTEIWAWSDGCGFRGRHCVGDRKIGEQAEIRGWRETKRRHLGSCQSQKTFTASAPLLLLKNTRSTGVSVPWVELASRLVRAIKEYGNERREMCWTVWAAARFAVLTGGRWVVNSLIQRL